MNEKLMLSILKLYKQKNTIERNAAFSELQKQKIILEEGEFSKSMDDLLRLNGLKETGLGNTYQYAGNVKLQKQLKKEIRLKKPIKERFWWLWPFIGYVAGIASPLIVKSIDQKIWPKSNLSKPTTPALIDTSRRNQNHP